MNNSKRDLGIAVVALLVGAVVGYLANRRLVPPPPFTGASFGNGAPKHPVATVTVYGWEKGAQIPPQGEEANIDGIDGWKAKFPPTITKSLDPLAPPAPPRHYFATTEAFGFHNIVRMAVVVELQTGVKYINFVPDAENLGDTEGFSHLNSWLTPAAAADADPTLNVRYFYGANEAPDKFVDDDKSHKK